MKSTSGDGQNELEPLQWPRVPKIDNSEEFQQSFAVAELAVRLCELKKANPRTSPTEKENLNPQQFLDEAWTLVESAREHVLREQTVAEYLAAHPESQEGAENAAGHILSKSPIPFQKLCDPTRNKGDTETIHGLSWKAFRTERGFDDLFGDYWRDSGQKWKSKDREIGTATDGNGRRINFYSQDERNQLARLASDAAG